MNCSHDQLTTTLFFAHPIFTGHNNPNFSVIRDEIKFFIPKMQSLKYMRSQHFYTHVILRNECRVDFVIRK